MSDDFKQPKQWASGTAIAQASEGSTAIVYNGPSTDELMKAISAVVFPGASGPNHLLLSARQLVTASPVAPWLPLKRKDLLRQLNGALEKEHAAVLKGDVGSGRSELARSYAENRSQTFWLDMEANAHLPPSLAVELFLQSVSPVTPSPRSSASRWGSIPKSALLVIENIGQTLSDPGFVARLGEIISNARANGYFVILSTIHPLPNPIKRLAPEVGVDRFSDEEVRELLSLHGASEAVVQSGMKDLVWGLTHGMPDLVDALLLSLSRRNWKLDGAALDDLLHSNYSSDLRANTQRLLHATETEPARELLYRLTLLNRAFSQREALETARVEPTIAKPLELFEELKGTWLQHAYQDRWRTSPLLNGTGEANLDRSIRIAVHSLAAHWILKDGSIDQYSAAEAITHLHQADRYNEAANVLIQSLQGLTEAPVDADGGLLLALWSDMPLPVKIGYGLRLFIRALQVVNVQRRKGDYLYALADLRALLASAERPLEHASAFAACSLVAYKLVDEEPLLSLPFASLAVSHEAHVPAELREHLDDQAPLQVFWAAAMKLDTRESVETWLVEVSQLTPEQIQKMMVTTFASDAAAFMFDRLWMTEQQKEEALRDWPSLLRFLDRCGQIAANWSHPLILACVLRSCQAVRIVHISEIEKALAEAERFYSRHEGVEAAVFLVAAGTAAWLIDIERWDLAAVWLTRAYMFQGPRLALYRFRAAIRYGELLFRSGAASAVPFEYAVALSAENEDLTDLTLLEARGELATYYYKTQQIDSLYREWSTVVREVLKNRHTSKRWKHFFVLTANHTGWFSTALGRTGAPSNLMTEPGLGMFVGDLRDLSDRYSEGVVFLQAGAMAQFADGLGKAKEAYEWAVEAADLGAVVSRNTSAEHFLTHAIPFDIQQKKYTLALEHAIRAARGFASKQALELAPEVEAERQQKNTAELNRKDDHFSRFAPINLGLVPVLIDIAANSDQNPTELREVVLSVLDVCRNQRESASDPLMWEIAIDALEQVLNGTTSISKASELNSEWSAPHQEESRILWTFAMATVSDAAPRDLWLAQGRIASLNSGFYRHFGNLGRTVCTSIAQVWLARIARSGYLFRLPQYTITAITKGAEEAHLGKILLAVAESLSLNLSDEYRDVLSSCTMTQPQ